MQEQSADGFYMKLREQLMATTVWPSDYLYKFIIPTDVAKVKTIHDIFDNTGAVIESKLSKKGNYTSLSITVNLKSPDEVIAKYRQVGQVEGVISL